MKLIEKIALTAATLLFLSVTPAVHAAMPYAAPDDPAAYINGTKAMNDHRWQDAINAFDQVINAKQAKTDAAIYWKAYSLNKLGNQPLALATCFQLHAQYANSSWNKDCEALGIDLKAYGEQAGMVPPVPPIPPLAPLPPLTKTYTMSRTDRDYEREVYRKDSGGDPNADIKMLALNSLLNQDPARAIPLLRGILSSNEQPSNIKRHALFVLAQSKSPEAQSILNDAVMGKLDPTLQRQAIQTMAVFKGKVANETLAEVYNKTSDVKTKQAVINAFFISQDAPRLVELAKNEKNMELKRSIVSQLALMHDKAATDYMIELLK